MRTLLGGWVLNPYLAFLLILGVGVATFRLEHHLRLTLLWLMLLGIVLLYAESGRLKADYSLLNLSRGALVGIIVALPFYLFAKDFFYATASRLYGVDDLQVLHKAYLSIYGTKCRNTMQKRTGLRSALYTNRH